MQDGSADMRPAGGRRLRWLLILSLGINLAVAGLVTGAVISGRAAGPPRGFDLSIGPIARALDREDRRWIMHELAQAGHGLPDRDRDRDRAPGAGIAAVIRAVTAEPFDSATLGAALDEMRLRGEAIQRATQEALVARIAAMTPEARAGFAARLQEQFASRDRPPPSGH